MPKSTQKTSTALKSIKSKKTAPKKGAVKKTEPAKKTVLKKVAAKKVSPKKSASSLRSPASKSPASKTLASKTLASKTLVKKAVVKASSKKSLPKSSPAKPKALVKTLVNKPLSNKPLAKKTPAKKSLSARARSKTAPLKTKSLPTKKSVEQKPLIKKSVKKSIQKQTQNLEPNKLLLAKATNQKLVANKSGAASPDTKRPPKSSSPLIKGEQQNMKAVVMERQQDVTKKVGKALPRPDKIIPREMKELDLSSIAEEVPKEVVDPGFLTNDDVFDEADHAQWQQLREQAAIHARAINLNKPEKHPDFDGVHCIDCDEKIPSARLLLSKVRCVDCQNDLEQKKKITDSRIHINLRSSDFDLD